MIRHAIRLIALFILLALGSPITARTFTVEDLLRTEGFGAVSFDPHDRYLVFARREGALSMRRFDMFSQEFVLRSRLYRVDLDRPWRAVPLLADPKPGVISYGFSTDGSRLAIGRLAGGHWRLGIVTMRTGAVRWTTLSPDYNPFYTTVAWISDDQLLAIVQPDGQRPWWLRMDAFASERLPKYWKATRLGNAAAVTVMGSGQFRNAGSPAPVNALVLVDARSGQSTSLASGRFLTMTLAPDREHVALVERGAATSLPLDRPLNLLDLPYRRVPAIYDLGRHQMWRPCPDCDVLGKASWAPDGAHLALFARRQDQDWPGAGLVNLDIARHVLRPVQSTGVAAVITQNLDGTAGAAFHWRGNKLVLFARPVGEPAGRADWYALNDGRAVSLTSGFSEVGSTMESINGCETAVRQEDGIWCLDGASPKQVFGRGVGFSNGWVVGWDRSADQIALTGNVLGGRVIRTETDGRIEGVEASPTGRMVVVRQIANDGVKTLTLVSRNQLGTIAQVNQRLRTVAPARTRPVVSLVNGRKVTSWLYLPPGAQKDQKLAMVVIPYPGMIYGRTPPPAQQPGTVQFYTNAQLLAAHGYAVLLPSMPAAEKPPSGAFPYAAELAPIVDAAIATGQIDANRIALWGHSYGGYTVALIASEAHRYKAIIASAGVYDLAAFTGTLPLRAQLAPEQGLAIGLNYAYVETGQGRMGAPPWRAPMLYVENSPVYRADKITTPILIVARDQDVSPLPEAEQLFSALFRQNKDAELVTYWGEGHVIGSPDNVRDFYRRVFNWLDRFLGAPDGRASPPDGLPPGDPPTRASNSR